MKRQMLIALVAASALANSMDAIAKEAMPAPREDYVRTALPPGIQVVDTELEGPLFANAEGRTLYWWPHQSQRNGFIGDEKNQSVCTNTVTRTSAGLMSPYPPGLVLPELEHRRSCAQEWPPVLATPDAKPVGKWTLIDRKDGARQWAYDGQAVYTFFLDQGPGDVLGGTRRREPKTQGGREPVGPPTNVPPGLSVVTTAKGRMLINDKGYSVYSSAQDGSNKSNCDLHCELSWKPVPAPAMAESKGEWTIVERGPSVKQWAFRGQPLYTYVRETGLYSQQGSDMPGWSNVYAQKAPEPPAPFTLQDTQSGVVVADANGKTVYVYTCMDDSTDQLPCDYPGAPSAYRIAICGGGDVDRCLKRWPYVEARPEDNGNSNTWSVIQIDPRTGNYAKAGQAGAIRVWAYRGRPVYTFADDAPGEIKGTHYGEWQGTRNGFNSLWVRDDFYRNDT